MAPVLTSHLDSDAMPRFYRRVRSDLFSALSLDYPDIEIAKDGVVRAAPYGDNTLTNQKSNSIQLFVLSSPLNQHPIGFSLVIRPRLNITREDAPIEVLPRKFNMYIEAYSHVTKLRLISERSIYLAYDDPTVSFYAFGRFIADIWKAQEL